MIKDSFVFGNGVDFDLIFIGMKTSNIMFRKQDVDGLLSCSSFIDQVSGSSIINSTIFSIFTGKHINFGGFDKHAILRGEHLKKFDMDPDLSFSWDIFTFNE